MANREKGEVGVEVGGQRYTLRPTLNAICDLEELTKKTMAQIVVEAQAGSVSAMRALVWCYLQDQHGEEIKTPRDAGAWIERAGGLLTIDAALQDLVALNHEEGGTKGRPLKARRQAGVNSTSPHAASV